MAGIARALMAAMAAGVERRHRAVVGAEVHSASSTEMEKPVPPALGAAVADYHAAITISAVVEVVAAAGITAAAVAALEPGRITTRAAPAVEAAAEAPHTLSRAEKTFIFGVAGRTQRTMGWWSLAGNEELNGRM